MRIRSRPSHLLRRCSAPLAAVIAALLVTSPAHAIENGAPDGTGHPYVGVLVSDYAIPGVKQRYCSGTLIAPRILLTAGHCIERAVSDGFPLDDFWVSFDSVYRAGVSTLYRGTGVVDPEFGYSGQFGFSDPHDIGVVHLNEAPPITPATLPTAGLLSSLDLRGQTFTAVGYGRTRVDKTSGPNNIEPNLFPDVRNVATMEFRSLQDHWLTASKNPATGDGGGCAGDSGGPQLLGSSNVVVAQTTIGDNVCRSLDQGYRLDTDSARQFLASQGVSLP